MDKEELRERMNEKFAKAGSEVLHIGCVMPRTFSKKSLKDAYIQGYRKRAIMSVLKYDSISELNAIAEFENWYANLYGA